MTNSKRLGAVLLGALVVAGMGTPVAAADVSAGADLYSAYVWRGITLGGTPVVQPWVDVSGFKLGEQVSFGFNVWSNVALSSRTSGATTLIDGGQFNEFDLTFTLTLPKGFKAGYIEYTFPHTLGNNYLATRELYGSCGLVGDRERRSERLLRHRHGRRLLRLGEPRQGLHVQREGQRQRGRPDWHGRRGLRSRYGGTKGGLYNYNLSAKLSYKAAEKVTLGAVVGYAGSLDKEVLPEQEDKFYAGANVSVGF